jgi:tRNA threonylcarbamoyladenosine biosynthesis protein TsaE
MQVVTHSPQETLALGRAIGRLLGPGDVVTLSGELGAGKTVMAQGLGQGLDVEEPVSSPTFTLVHEYAGRVPVRHLDVYRQRSADELIDLSRDDLLRGGGAVLVEWPERIHAALPDERLDVTLTWGESDSRRIDLEPRGARMTGLARSAVETWRAGPARE